MSYYFDGSDDRMALASPRASVASQRTIVAWIKPTGYVGRATIHAHYDGANDEYNGFYGAAGGDGGALRFRAEWDGQSGVWRTGDDTLVLDAWQAVAVTYDAGSTSNVPAFYRKPQGGGFSSLSAIAEQSPTGAFQDFADEEWVGGVSGSYLFAGRLAYVRQFNSLLSTAQIEDEMDAAAAVATAALDLPLLADANDDSGNGHHGTASGAVLDGDNPTLPGGGGGGDSAIPLTGRQMAGGFAD